MATSTICDLCEEAPRQAGETHRPTPATWTVDIRTIKDSTVSVLKHLDACDRHVGDAAMELAKMKGATNFHSILLATF